jgi:hypothetical protein
VEVQIQENDEELMGVLYQIQFELPTIVQQSQEVSQDIHPLMEQPAWDNL